VALMMIGRRTLGQVRVFAEHIVRSTLKFGGRACHRCDANASEVHESGDGTVARNRSRLCAFKKYFGTKRVVAKSELLGRMAVAVDVERNGDLGTLGSLLLLLDVDLDFASGSQLVSGPGMHADLALLHPRHTCHSGLQRQFGGETSLLAFVWPRRTGINQDFVHRGSAEVRSGGCSFHYSRHR
jgi:hypothetical protein